MTPQILLGTGAIAFQEWKGRFYPKDLPAADALRYYARTFSTLELNSSFYRMPDAAAIKQMVAAAPPGFPIAIKMPRLITHIKRLKNCEKPARDFFKALPRFQKHLGPVLLQLPPNFKIDMARLEEFFELIPKRIDVAVEFRHPSWFVKPVVEFLKQKKAALVFNDTDVKMPWISTARWGFLRLRRLAYSDRALKSWLQKINRTKWTRAFVIFKHEEKATAPKLALRFRSFDAK
jgi:uncharacterized protein YecE (DUF72 family)